MTKLKTIQEAKENVKSPDKYAIKWLYGAPLSWSTVSDPEKYETTAEISKGQDNQIL